jgi:peptide/nickel transport system substrate-binding protein
MVEDSTRRREYLKWLGIAGAASVAGCAGDGGSETEGGDTATDESDSTGGGDTDTETATDDGGGGGGDGGGEYRVAYSQVPNNLNPILTADAQSNSISRWTYSWLTWLDTDLEVHPHLATDWESNDAGDQWTFQLREDAVFHHSGNTVIAEDVKASFDTVYSDDVSSPGNGNMGPIESVEVVNDQRVQFNMETPFVELPKAVALAWGAILPKNVLDSRYDELSAQTFGSGPFVLDEYEAGTEASFVQADEYYLTDSEGNELPYLDRVTVTAISEPSTKISALQNGDVDGARNVSAPQWDRTTNMSGVETYQTQGGFQFPIFLRNTTEPFTDTRVIQAFKYALDREEILSAAHDADLGYPAPNQTPIPPISPDIAEDLQPDYGINAKVDRAEQLLADAGYEDGLELEHTLQVPSSRSPPVQPQAINFQSQMARVGIEFDIQEITWDTFISDIEGSHPFYISALPYSEWTQQALFLALHPDSFLNGCGDWSDEYVEVVEESIQITDTERRVELYKEAQQIAHREAGFISPFYMNVASATRDYVDGVRLDPLNKLYHVRWMHIEE